MKNLNEEQLIALATSLTLKIAKNNNDNDELLILADFFSLLGSMLDIIYDRRSLDSTTVKDTPSK